MRWLRKWWQAFLRQVIMDDLAIWHETPETLLCPLVHDLAQVERELITEARKQRWDRNLEYVEFLLTMRSALAPAQDGSQLLRTSGLGR